MSYHIYTTDGIILKRTPFGEANILLHILTEQLGLIIASARSARLAVSKLRPALQEYALVSVSVIHGKGGWKVTNVVEKNNFYFDVQRLPLQSFQSVQKVIARIASVLMQMIPGESPHPEIFQTIKSGFEFLKTLDSALDSTPNSVQSFEIIAVLRVLYQLGYVVSNTETETFLKEPNMWSPDLLAQVFTQKPTLVGIINKALKESQLT